MAKKKGRNTLSLDTSALEELIKNFEQAGKNVEKITEKALLAAAEKITTDTKQAIEKPNLPAQGKYSQGDTAKTIIENPKVAWTGKTASVNVGFDFSKKGAGGYLISGYFYNDKKTGTAKQMRAVQKLDEIYKQKKYMQQVEDTMVKAVQTEIKKELDGK